MLTTVNTTNATTNTTTTIIAKTVTNLFSGYFLLLAPIGARNRESLTDVQMCDLFIYRNGALAELACHVPLRAVISQMFVNKPLLKLCSTATGAGDLQVLAIFIMRLEL